jgi:L-fucose mutarotase/ribose pyranase (RbsD/FucU family)
MIEPVIDPLELVKLLVDPGHTDDSILGNGFFPVDLK